MKCEYRYWHERYHDFGDGTGVWETGQPGSATEKEIRDEFESIRNTPPFPSIDQGKKDKYRLCRQLVEIVDECESGGTRPLTTEEIWERVNNIQRLADEWKEKLPK